MANFPIRVTEGQRSLILWLEDEKNFEYLVSVINEKYQSLLEYHVGYLKYQSMLTTQHQHSNTLSEEHGRYVESELEKVVNMLSIVSMSKRGKDNPRNARGKRQ